MEIKEGDILFCIVNEDESISPISVTQMQFSLIGIILGKTQNGEELTKLNIKYKRIIEL